MFLHNAWYVGATAQEVSRKPQRRRILNEPVVFYRRENGAVVAMADSCPHRFAQLSAGFLVGDDIECRYHGLRFSPEGHCMTPFTQTLWGSGIQDRRVARSRVDMDGRY
jgi:phenylpropionate dioxygenase-like ring-hydroxylating dioxygenase large terminal subunit